ncbi:MAG: hypothetical protein ACO3FI_05900 [Cyclobacteriaceae bacterium]
MPVIRPASIYLRVLLLLACLSGSTGLLMSQDFPVLDTNPASVRWRQIKTEDFRIIFPYGFEPTAQRMANTFQHIRGPESRSLGTPSVSRMPVILQNRSSISNGFVTLAPRRSELYTMPTQNYNFSGTNDWLNLLAGHEYRHMAQFAHSNRGFNRLFSTLFGQEALFVMSYISVPRWFWEGDAVAIETAFTTSGRGRIPEFDMVFRTNVMEGRTFNYNKQVLRSYKHYIPNHYVLGYHMVSHLREVTRDPEIWGKITARTWSAPFIPGRFSNSIRREAGINVTGLYKSLASGLKQEWTTAQSGVTFTEFDTITKRTGKTFTNYSYPQYLSDGRIIAMKSGIGDAEKLVVLSESGEEFSYMPGPVNDAGMLSAAGSVVVWSEFRFDPRWPVRTWSVIRAHDTDSTKYSSFTVTRKSRYSGASISPDGLKIAAVESDENYKVRLVVIDFYTGKVLRSFENESGAFLSMPRWNNKGDAIAVLRQSGNLRSVLRIDYSSGQTTTLLPASEVNIGHPVIHGEYLFYNAPFEGVDNIFALHIPSEKKFRVTVSKYGAYNASISPDGKFIAYSNMSRDGLDVVRIPFEPAGWSEYISPGRGYPESWSHLAEQEGRPFLFDSIPDVRYTVKPYRKMLRAINPHSWGAFVGADLTRASFGITSRDVLSNLSLYAGVEADIQERTPTWKGRASLQSFYPIIDVGYDYGKRNVKVAEELVFITDINDGDTTRTTAPLSFSWTERTTEAGLRIPLNLTQSRFFTQFNLSGYFGSTSVNDFQNSFDNGGRVVSSEYPQYFFRNYQDNGKLFYTKYRLSAYNLMRTSPRDINSRWGQAVFFNSSSTLKSSDFSGRQQSVTAYLYFPGLFRHHSLWGYWAFQNTAIDWRNRDDYNFRNEVPLPRGSAVSRSEKMYSMALNYTLPVWYPDLAIGSLVNFRRVRLNSFADYAFGDNPQLAVLLRKPQATNYVSFGGEVKFDINVLRLAPQLDLGFRVAQVVAPVRSFYFEFLLGTFNF